MSRIVLATIGSLGDLHPLIAIGLELHRHGHEVSFCTSETYRSKLKSLGFGFSAMRPDATPENESVAHLVKAIMDPRKGAERLIREWLMPQIQATCADLKQAVIGPPVVDLLISGELVYPAPLIVEKFGIRWASHITAPMSFFSAHDPPVLAPIPTLSRVLRGLGLGINRSLIRLIKRMTRTWSEPIERLRTEMGLLAGHDPIYEGKFSRQLVLATFSRVLASVQPDWPAKAIITGFPFYDGEDHSLPLELVKFLAAGEPPLVFTLGSSAVHDPGNFYSEGAKAARLLGRRAVLLVGRNPIPAQLPEGVIALGYIPFSELFPHASAVVHQGGIGTTGQVLRAGRPMLVMPYNFDQPDNAARIVRLGAGRVILRGSYSARRVAHHLQALLGNPNYARRAAELGRQVRQEQGAKLAAEAIERLLTST